MVFLNYVGKCLVQQLLINYTNTLLLLLSAKTGSKWRMCIAMQELNIFQPDIKLARSISTVRQYRGADKSLARPRRKKAIVAEDFELHISYL